MAARTALRRRLVNIIILDDYQDAVRKLKCASKLESLNAKVFTNTVKGIFKASGIATGTLDLTDPDDRGQRDHGVERAVAGDLFDAVAEGCDGAIGSRFSHESLLVNWLSEALYYMDARRILLRRFKVERIEPETVVGRGWGEPFDARRHQAKEIVKGVTYHQLKIERAGDVWRATVFLDV